MINYTASVFRLCSLLEKLGIEQAIYTHKDEARMFASRFGYDKEVLKRNSALTQYIASGGPRLRMGESGPK